MRHVAAEGLCELGFVVGIELNVVPAPRDRDVGQALIEELCSGAVGVDMYEHAVGGLPLAAVTRHRIAVVQMARRIGV